MITFQKMIHLCLTAMILLSPIVLANNSHTLALDGEWDILFDHNSVGHENNWHINKIFSKQSAIKAIDVPSAWELIEQD